jgi:hypothetical protein
VQVKKEVQSTDMRKLQLSLLLLLSSAIAHAQSPVPKSSYEFHEPFRVEAGGKAIDVRRGDIFPEYVDIDEDGVKDLLVGDFQEGVIRIYKNHGTNAKQKFEDYTLLQTEEGPAHVRYGCCVGFRPMYADLNGDGIKDILTGSYMRNVGEGKQVEGELHFFAGKGKGVFAKDQILTWPDGSPLAVGWSTSPCVTDWDGDRIPDLIVGTGPGQVWFVRNKGKMQFEPAKALATSEGTTIKGSDGGPYVVDWDGDGVNDLILGEGWGSIRLYKGSKAGLGEPVRLASPVELVPAYQATRSTSGKAGVFFVDYKAGTAPTQRPAGRVKVSVTDWNGDGKLDLLAGDVVTAFKLPDPDADETKRNAAIAERDGEYQRIAAIQASSKGQAAKDAEIAAARKRIAEADDLIYSTLRGAEASLHGYVWVYLQK